MYLLINYRYSRMTASGKTEKTIKMVFTVTAGKYEIVYRYRGK